jgi:hypothetical protein
VTVRGLYGLALRGTDLPAGDAPAGDWPEVGIAVDVTGAPEPPARRGLYRHRGTYPLSGGGRVLLTRRPLSMTFRLPRPPADDLLHPYLSIAAAAVSYWLGRDPFHGGAVVGAGGAWMIAGRSGAGKSTLLAALARAGAGVLADDLVVTDGGHVFAGPRTVDLRPESAAALGAGTRTVAARGDSRRRVPLPAVPARVPLAGWVDLAWGHEVSLRRMAPAERLRRLAQRRMFPAKLPVGGSLFDVAAVPGYVLTRPRSFAALESTVDALDALAGTGPGG